MLSIYIRRIDDTGGEAIAHIQITRRDEDDDYNYRWIIESDGEVVDGGA